MNQDEALEILKMGVNVFLTGQAGAGKTYVINSYIDYLRKHKIKTAVTATTGIAATHVSGTTIHSWSGLGIRETLSDEDIDELIQKEKIYKNFSNTDVLIIDEISMLHGTQLSSIEKLARYIRQNNMPFGGIQIVLIGDFFQLPPVTKLGPVNFAFEYEVWKNLRLAVCYLTTQYRQDDARLERVLSDIRSGSVDEDTVETLSERIVSDIKTDREDVTKLYTHNVDVDSYNQKRLGEIKETQKIFMMESKGNKTLIEVLKKSCLSPESLSLTVGARVMFVKNNYEKGYVNGSIGHVLSLKGRYPLIEMLDGKTVEATPEDWQIEEGGKVLATVSQIPLRLAWAITVHKSQGMSLDEAEMDLADCFVPGQGYVALSRVKTLEGITLLGLGPMALRMDERVQNFDSRLRESSEKAASRLESLERGEIKDIQNTFIVRSGGVLEEIKEEELKNQKLNTYEKTLNLINQKKSLTSIAELRGLSTETVLSHIEHLKSLGAKMDIEYLRPDNLDISKILEVFEDLDTDKLSPVKQKLGDKYSFQDIRIARLFLN